MPWYTQLPAQLKHELPRWRWTPHLRQRGGTLDGETQKQNVHIEIDYARGHFIVNAYGLLGRRQPQWTLTIGDGKCGSLDEVVTLIVGECS